MCYNLSFKHYQGKHTAEYLWIENTYSTVTVRNVNSIFNIEVGATLLLT